MTALPHGLVVANFGRRLLVEDESGRMHVCHPKGRQLQAVCGDRVRWQPIAGASVVTEILPRRSLLTRPTRGSRDRGLAANADRLLIMTAPLPAPDLHLLDHYLAAAEAQRLPALLLFNKIDLPQAAECQSVLAEFTALGYPFYRLSARNGEGLAALAEALRGHCSVLVGQSGVGKSSLLAALLPEAKVRIGELSRASGQGRHTTTTAVLYRLPGGGSLIDSPGVRGFQPPSLPRERLAHCFVEFRPLAAACRFADCRHLEEPGCAVRAAVAAGRISARRYASYRRLCAEKN